MNFFKRLMQIGLAFSLFGTTFWSLGLMRLPHLGFEGFVGYVNVTIIVYLLLVSLRYFIFLFFSTREEIRRDFISDGDFFPLISILVPAYNEEKLIGATLKSLSGLDYPSFEVIVIDDGSSDQTFLAAREAVKGMANFRVFTKPNGGKSTALNFGISRARGEYIFCMDADSVISPAALRVGIRHFTRPEISAVAGAVLVLNQDRAITRFQALEYLMGLNFFKSAQSFLGLVTIVPGPAGLFRKKAVEDLGGYTSDTFAEDTDLSLRLLMAGHRIVYEPYMEVQTEVPDTIRDVIKQRYRWNRGTLQATIKHVRKIFCLFSDPVSFLIVFQILAETFALPIMNLSIAVLSLIYQIATLDFSFFGLWLFVLTFMDLSLVVVCLRDVRWPLKLIVYGVVNRFTYAFFQDIIKFLSAVEEFLGVRMNWGKLDRIGAQNE